MSTFIGTEIVNSGLVFHYDANNILRSWKGPPATNLFTETNLLNWSTNAPITLNSYNTPFGSPSYTIIDNSSSYLSMSRNTTVPNDSSSYTISVLVKKTYGATSARLGFNVGFTGGTAVAANYRFNSDTGVTNGGASFDLGDWWYWYFTITNNSTGNTTLYCNFYPATGFYNSSDNSAANGVAVIGDLMLVAGSTAARFVSGTRSNTQAILDLTNNNTLVANGLSYAANNTFSFNGITDRIYTSTNTTYGSNTTWEAWVLRTSSLNTYNMFMGRYLPYFGMMSDGRIIFSNRVGGSQQTIYSTGFAAVNNTWYHLAFSTEYDGTTNTTARIYINGVLNNSGLQTGSHTQEVERFTIGTWYSTDTAYPFQGKVDSVKVYNRTLSAREIRQNFEATRSRYRI